MTLTYRGQQYVQSKTAVDQQKPALTSVSYTHLTLPTILLV